MFDSDMILIDGTVSCADATPASHIAAVSTTRVDASGAAVIDLGAGGTPAGGLSAVLFIPALTSSTDYLIATIEVCDEEAFGSVTYHEQTVVTFNIAGVTDGRILASECTSARVVIGRFATPLRYVRAVVDPQIGNSAGNMGAIKIYLTPYAFNVL